MITNYFGKHERVLGQKLFAQTILFGKTYIWVEDGEGKLYLISEEKFYAGEF